jgi:hypothetical protein
MLTMFNCVKSGRASSGGSKKMDKSKVIELIMADFFTFENKLFCQPAAGFSGPVYNWPRPSRRGP